MAVLEQYRKKKWGPCKRGVMSLLEIVGWSLMGYMELQQQRMEEELLQIKGSSCEIGSVDPRLAMTFGLTTTGFHTGTGL